MTKSGAVIHVIIAKSSPDKFLKNIIVFIGAFGRSIPRQGISSIIYPNFIESSRNQFQRLIPADRLELPITLYQRLRQAGIMVDKIVAEAPLDAQPAIVGFYAFYPVTTYNAIVADHQFDLAAHATIGAGGNNRMIRLLMLKQVTIGLFDDGARRAKLDTLTASIAFGPAPYAESANHIGPDSALSKRKDIFALHLITGLDASKAFDALRRIVSEDRRTLIKRVGKGFPNRGKYSFTWIFQTIYGDEFSELIIITFIRCFIMFAQQTIEQKSSGFFQFFIESGYFQVISGADRAGGNQSACAIYLHDAQPASTGG
jgi:hypothetical protein